MYSKQVWYHSDMARRAQAWARVALDKDHPRAALLLLKVRQWHDNKAVIEGAPKNRYGGGLCGMGYPQ